MFVVQMRVGAMDVFAYIVGDKDSGIAAVIDPADDTNEIIGAADLNGLKIKYIINTHGHVDHVGGNADMQKATGAEILIHEDDANLLISTPLSMLKMFGAKASPLATTLLHDGVEIPIGGTSLRVIHTPGHTPGSVCLYGDGRLFTGDTLFVGSVGRTDLPGGSGIVMERSLRERIMTLPAATLVFPGHDYGSATQSTIGQEIATNPYLR